MAAAPNHPNRPDQLNNHADSDADDSDFRGNQREDIKTNVRKAHCHLKIMAQKLALLEQRERQARQMLVKQKVLFEMVDDMAMKLFEKEIARRDEDNDDGAASAASATEKNNL